MSVTKWVLTPLLAAVLVIWAVGFTQAADQGQADDQDRAMSDQPLGPNPAARAESPKAREEMSRKGRQETDASLRKWGDMQPAGPPREGMAARPPATQPSAGPQATRQPPADVDIFLFEEPNAPRGYWSPSARGETFGFRGEPGWSRGQIYGYEEGMTAPAPARMGAVVQPVPEDASHNWWQGKNLVDDNLIQTRDQFDESIDFYTKEWKIAAPPLVAHPHFHTIYDNELTQRYYTNWFGSPVNWAPNMMVEVALPEHSNELFTSKKQMVTYFTPWEKGEYSNEPNTFATATARRTYATRGFGGGVYGYQGEEFEGPGMVSRDGALFAGGEPLYFDDQDVLGGFIPTGAGGGAILGYVSPEAETGNVTIERGAPPSDNMHLNEPWSTDVSIYGVPTNREGEATEVLVQPEPEVYGYVGEEEHAVKEHKVKKDHKEYKTDKECREHEDED